MPRWSLSDNFREIIVIEPVIHRKYEWLARRQSDAPAFFNRSRLVAAWINLLMYILTHFNRLAPYRFSVNYFQGLMSIWTAFLCLTNMLTDIVGHCCQTPSVRSVFRCVAFGLTTSPTFPIFFFATTFLICPDARRGMASPRASTFLLCTRIPSNEAASPRTFSGTSLPESYGSLLITTFNHVSRGSRGAVSGASKGSGRGVYSVTYPTGA